MFLVKIAEFDTHILPILKGTANRELIDINQNDWTNYSTTNTKTNYLRYEITFKLLGELSRDY